MDFKTLLVLACVAAGSLAGPVRERQCASRCESRDEGMFRAFKSYFFNYEVTIDSRIDGGISDQTSRVRVQATAAIEGLSACEMVLKFSDVGISEMRQDGSMVTPETASTFTDSLQSHPLRFAMESNGTITSLCPEAGEVTWALNVKRGFLSAIQTKRTRRNEALGQAGIFETDVTGTCMPMYQSEDNVITKTQDYLMCKDRTSLNMFVDAIPVHMLAPTTSPMTSHLECRYEMDAQGLTSVACTENHTLKPFGQSESQPLTSVVTSITRTSITHRITSSLSSEFARQTTLLYEDPHLHSNIDSADVLETLTGICDSMANGIGSETPGLFESLTHQLGQMDTDNMNTVINRLFRMCSASSASTRKDVTNMVKDALIDCDSEQCIQGFNTIMQTQNSAENNFYLRKWLMKLVFHKNPTQTMIGIVRRHVSGKDVNVQAYYALSSMIHRYCLISETDCSVDVDILAAAAIFEDNLNDSCQPETEEEEKKMLISLRAIGNMGLVRSKTLMNRCNRDRNPYKIRIAAIEAFRRAACDNMPTDRFMRIFSTTDNDSELRIAAYRAMVRCMTAPLLEGIANVMAHEPTHQVTCYVSSHLSNLRDSQNPLLHDVQTTVRESSLVNITQCNMDIRKFSHNYAFSRYDDASGNGINVDSDVIFSSSSYLPRSFRLGMDIDLFGYELDLFEFNARTEGLQDLFETFIGSDEDDRESNMLKRVNHLLQKRIFRPKREGVKASSINRIKTKYLQNYVLPEDSQEAAISMKIMDSEVFYKDQDDFQRLADKFSRENILMLIASLTQQRTHEYTLNKNFRPSKATIPTICGMPLEVNIQGALTTSLKASGKLDVTGLAVKPRSMAVVGSFEPSSAIEVHSSMMVNAHCARSGLSHKTNMASSLTLGGSVTLEQGMLKVRVDAPQRRQTILNASTSLYFMQNNELVPVAEAEDGVTTVNETFTSPHYSLHIGGCRPSTAVSFPESLFHTRQIEIYFNKLDDSLLTYDLEVGYRVDKEYRNGEIQKTDRFHMLVGTPGSESFGVYSVDLTYYRSNMTLSIHTLSPVADTLFTASLGNETNHKNLQLRATHNGREFAFQAGLDTIPLNNGIKYIPVFNLTISDLESYVLDGNVTCTGTMQEFDLSLLNRNRDKLIAFKGDFISNSTLHRLSISRTLGPYTASLQVGAQIETTPDSLSVEPIFNMATGIRAFSSLRLDGTPIVISNTGVRMNELYLTTRNTRLVEMSNFHVESAPISFGFEGKIKETIPFGVQFYVAELDEENAVAHTADLTATSMFGVYHVQGTLTNQSSDHLYGLDINTDVNNTEYFSLSVNFKNEIHVLQFLDTIVTFRNEQLFRSKNGLRQRVSNSKTRYWPITLLELPSLGSFSTKGSCDVSQDGITIRDMALTGTEDLISLSGSAGVDREMRRVDWSFRVGGAYVTETIEGYASHLDNTVLFNNVIVIPDETQDPPTYSLTVDLRNSTTEGQIFAWDSKIELDISHHSELSFRFDSQYDLSPGSSSGNLLRLCYDGIDCTSTDKVITFGHELIYDRDSEIGVYSHDLRAIYTHPAQNKDYSLTMTTGCYRGVSFSTQLFVQDGSEVIFDTSITHIPEISPKNGSVIIEFEIPGVYSYGSRDYYSFSSPSNIYWLSEYRAGEQQMSFEFGFGLTREGESGMPMTSNMVMKYTDIRNNIYTYQDDYHISPSNGVRQITIKKNDIIKISVYEQSVLEVSEARIYTRNVYVAKTTFVPAQEFSFNSTVDVDLANKNNANVQLQLRFMPNQKPITLITNFNNKTTESKKEGELTTTLSLPSMSITVFSGGKLEGGVPSGNLSIKFLPFMGQSNTFGVDLVVNNKSTAQTHNYDTYLIFNAPEHKSTLKHTLDCRKDEVMPLSSTLTGAWNDEAASVGLTASVIDDAMEVKVALSMPDHVYVFTQSQSQDGMAQNFTITKDSATLTAQRFAFETQTSTQGVTHTLRTHYDLMGYVLSSTVTLANLTGTYSLNAQIQENAQEALYTDVTINHYQGRNHFDVATETRSEYLPGYNTKFTLLFEKTESDTEFSSSINVADNDLFSFDFTNGTSSDDPTARVTRIIMKQPSHPDLRLRQFIIQDSCSWRTGLLVHNTTVLWGSLLPTQIIGLRLKAARNDTAVGATMHLLNPGRVMGFGSQLTVTLDNTRTGFNRNNMLSVYGETGNIISVETDYKNSSRDSMKDHLVKVTLTRANKEPIAVLTTVVFNSSNTLMAADLSITYDQATNQKLTAGVEITRLNAGHSIVLILQHLVNSIDVSIMGSYSNTSSEFEMTLENSVLIGDERYQPEISFSLNRDTKEVDITYTGSGTYGFHGQFFNRSVEDGRIYQVNCRNNYDGRIVPYELLLDERDRMIAFRVNYNPDNINDIWEFSAGLFNDTSVYAQLDTIHSDQQIRNGSVVLSMTTPKVLTSHIKWEPSWPADLKAAVLNIVEKANQTRVSQIATICSTCAALAEKISQTSYDFSMANMDLVLNALTLQTQIETQWALNQPLRQAQINYLKSMWTGFNQTLHANLPRIGAELARRNELYNAEYEDINEYFTSGFVLYSEDVEISWALFEEDGSAVPEQFDPEAIAAHFNASLAAKNEFWKNLFVQLSEDWTSMDPDYELIASHFEAIGENMRIVGARITEAFNRRISVLDWEKTEVESILEEIRTDIRNFNSTAREAVAGWKEVVQAELELFRHSDLSQFAQIRQDVNETARMVLAQLRMQLMTGGSQFFINFAPLILRERRNAPPITTMDIAAIQKALNKLNIKSYRTPVLQAPITDISEAVSVAVVESAPERRNFSRVCNVLKKIFNGTYEMTKLDLANGEIFFKIFIPDFNNYTSLVNLTRPYLERFLPARFNISRIERIIAMFENEELMSEYQRRFQEQFTPNRTRYREIMRNLTADLRAHIQWTIETRVKPYIETKIKPYIDAKIRPYLERLDQEISQRSRPFFGSGGLIPQMREQSTFLEELVGQYDVASMERMVGKVKQTMCSVYNKMTSAVMTARKATCPRRWIPPYRANALIVGAKHYMTFDQQFYDFSGKCGYLLAKDFVHENDFSAIVDYEREMEIPIRNMMFMINSTTFEIKSDGSVRVNRQLRELPFQVDDTVVLRIGDSILLKNAHGISYICKLPHDVCIMKLSGRYFARTGGLLGNFNFEPFDDLKTPDNELQPNITAFADSWKVGKNCLRTGSQDRNRVTPSSMDSIVDFDPLHPDNQHCATMFLDNCSPLARCHAEVDPDAFYRMCVLDTHDLSEEERNPKMCSIAAAYKSQCFLEGHPISMPDTCITCQIGDETFNAGAPRKIVEEEVPHKVDVVLVVEEKHCAESIAPRLDALVMRLAGELKDNGFNDTQFGLAAFGGFGVHDVAHQHTINHKIFNNQSNEFVLGRDSLEFDDEGSNDTFAAIRLAANYPFRTGVAKHIILLSCSECRQQDTRMQFSDLSVMLNKRGISLTMLTDFQFSLKKEMSKAKSKFERVYGIDATSVYTSKMAGQDSFKGDRTLREFVNEPISYCTLLAQETNGAIFDSNMLGNKGFDEVFVKRVVKNSEPAPCQNCRCVPDQIVGTGRSVCEICPNPANPLEHVIRGGIRDFELRFNLPHYRFTDQESEEEE